MTVSEGLSPSDADWMQCNVVTVVLEEGQTWYVKPGEKTVSNKVP